MSSSLSTKAIKMTNIRFTGSKKKKKLPPQHHQNKTINVTEPADRLTTEESSLCSRSEFDSILDTMKSMQESNLRAVNELSSSVRALATRMDEKHKAEEAEKNTVDVGENEDSSFPQLSSDEDREESANPDAPVRRRSSILRNPRERRGSDCSENSVCFSGSTNLLLRMKEQYSSMDSFNEIEKDDDSPPQDRRSFLQQLKHISIPVDDSVKPTQEKEKDEDKPPQDRRALLLRMKPQSKSMEDVSSTQGIMPPQERCSLLLHRKRQSGQERNPVDDNESSTQEIDDDKEDIELDRVSIRLDGVEVYAVVSALTLATAVTSFEMIDASHWHEHLSNWNIYKLIIIFCNFVVGSLGIAAGLHSVIVFSLSLMYGRTAVGLSHDEAYDEFFTKTAFQRVRGFRSFLVSMYALMVQMVILIESRCPNLIKPLVLGMLLWLMHEIHVDTQSIITGAECIFRPPPKPKKGEEQKRKVGDVAMRATSMRVLASSSRSLMSSVEDSDDE